MRGQAQQGAVGSPAVAPYGSWKSPITSNLITRQSIKLSEVRLDGDDIYWLEDRPQENGRCVIVRAPDSSINPTPFSARTEVHTYGGGAWIVDDGNLYFGNLADGRLYRQDRNIAQPEPITPAPPSPEKNWRYADGLIDRSRNRWVGVREDHTDSNRDYPDNAIVAVPLRGSVSSAGVILASGHDFYSSPRLSPDGKRLAWLAWDHPNMPWTASTLYMSRSTTLAYLLASRPKLLAAARFRCSNRNGRLTVWRYSMYRTKVAGGTYTGMNLIREPYDASCPCRPSSRGRNGISVCPCMLSLDTTEWSPPM
jgi:hypothetical protein